MKSAFWSTLVIAFIALGAGAAGAQDIKELAGVVPGQVMPEVRASAATQQSPMPFVFFSAPTASLALAKVFPSAELYVMKDGTVVGARWKRAYKSKQECAGADAMVRSLLRPYLPSEVSSKEKGRYQMQTKDSEIGAGISCKQNAGNFQELILEVVHFRRDAELSALLGRAR